MQARHYAPALGRFIQPDPDQSEDNLYSYAANNPVTEIDPDGNCFVVCGIVNAVIDTAIYLVTTDSSKWNLRDAATEAAKGFVTGSLGYGLLSKVTKVGSVARAFSSGSTVRSTARAAVTRAVSSARRSYTSHYTPYSKYSSSSSRLTTSARSACGRSFSAETLVTLADGSQTPIASLEVGDMVLAADEHTGEVGVHPITAVWLNEDPVSGWLVIDDEIIVTTPDHPFFVVGRGWVEAGDLRLGDLVSSASGDSGVVTSMSWSRGPDRLYDLTVADAHTFYVGEGEWLVHNCSRRILERELKDAGFRPKGGAKPERWAHPDGRWTELPRHKEIARGTAESIRKVIRGGAGRGRPGGAK